MTGASSRSPITGRRRIFSGFAALAGAPVVGPPIGAPASPAWTLLGEGVVSVLACGAVGDGAHDDTDGFLRACAQTPLNGLVVVPRTRGTYRIRRPIPLASRSLAGIGNPALVLDTQDPETDLLEVSTQTGTYDEWHQSVVMSGLVLQASGRGRDLIRVLGADSPQLRDLRLFGAGRDGLHVEGVAEGSWTESLNAVNVFISSSERDNFHLAIPEEAGNTFVTQSTFINCKSRAPGRYALACVNRSRRGGDNQKISELSWVNGELDASGGNADDIVFLQALGDGLVENLSFYDVAIEDGHAAHGGFAIGTEARAGGKIGPVHAQGCIPYGAARGLIDRDKVAQYSGDRASAGARSEDPGGGKWRGSTALLPAGDGEAIGPAMPARLMKVFAATDGRTTPPAFGEWTVVGKTIASVHFVGCVLSLADGRLLLRNTSTGPAIFDWRLQTLL